MKLKVGMYGHWKVLYITDTIDKYGKVNHETKSFRFLGELSEITKNKEGTLIRFCEGPRGYMASEVVGFHGIDIPEIKAEV